MKKNFFILLILVLSLSGCGTGEDGLDGLEGFDGIGDGFGGFELSDCDIKKIEIDLSYSEKVIKIQAKADSLWQERDQFETEYFDNYATDFDNIIIVFESEGGDLIKLDEQLLLLDEEINAKYTELNENQDLDSPEWRDKRTLLEIEIEELRLELYSVVGSETKALVTDFLAFIKASLLELNELEDNTADYFKYIDSEIASLDAEKQAAIEALNCE